MNLIEDKKIPEETILVSMDVTSLYTNIPQEEGIKTICIAYDNSLIPRQLLETETGRIYKSSLS